MNRRTSVIRAERALDMPPRLPYPVLTLLPAFTMDNPFVTIFGFVGVFYGLILPASILLVLTLLFIPAMIHPGAQPRSVGEAVYCFSMQIVSVILMTVGALPTVYSVFAGVPFTGRTYVSLLAVFACGGVLFLMHEQKSHRLDPASKAVPEAITFFLFKILGNVIAILATLSILLALVTGATEAADWWITPLVLLLYGLLLVWCTREEEPSRLFESVKLSAAKKTAAKGAARKT